MDIKATYSLEDNKIRLYASERLDPDTYKRVRDAGFIYAPKQGLFVAPMWTPDRERLALDLAGDIDNEDVSLEQRAEERAERFSAYSSNRAADANRYADAADNMSEPFKNGQPILIGHHSQRKAERLRDKIQSTMQRAVKFYDQSEYWSTRSESVIRHAASKSNPRTRINRIKGLEADQRRQERAITDDDKRLAWCDLDKLGKLDLERQLQVMDYLSTRHNLTPDERQQYNIGHTQLCSAYELLKSGYPLAAIVERSREAIERSKAWHTQWLEHYKMRIGYEREMLKASGHEMPDFKAIGAARRAKTTAAPIVNTPDLPGCVTITKDQYKECGSSYAGVRRSECGRYRYRVALARLIGHKTESGFGYVTVYIKDQKRVEVPA